MVFITQDGFAYQRQYAGIPSGLLNTQYLDSYCNIFVMIHALLEFGATSDEILKMRFFIMGDDNSAFLHWSLTKTQQFITFLAEFALQRYNMKINLAKSITTDQRQHIQTLSYECNFGTPCRQIDKLLAQLCYPEHGPIDKYMSARAIGIAYASCGQDPTFYDFCRDVFYSFLPYAEPITPAVIDKMYKYMPGTFKMMDEIPDYLYKLEFPSLLTIHAEIERWKGELPFSPKWNFSHFINPPNYVPPSPTTLEEANANLNYNLEEPPALHLG